MTSAEIRRAIKAKHGENISASSVKTCVARRSSGEHVLFVREAGARFRLAPPS